ARRWTVTGWWPPAVGCWAPWAVERTSRRPGNAPTPSWAVSVSPTASTAPTSAFRTDPSVAVAPPDVGGQRRGERGPRGVRLEGEAQLGVLLPGPLGEVG